MNTVYTSSTGYNAPVFRNLLKLYAQPFGHILDATYGAGGFWNQSRDLIGAAQKVSYAVAAAAVWKLPKAPFM